MKQQDFIQAVDQRLHENKQLSVGGLPAWLRPGGSLIGLKTPQVLSVASLTLTIILFWLFPDGVRAINALLFGWWL